MRMPLGWPLSIVLWAACSWLAVGAGRAEAAEASAAPAKTAKMVAVPRRGPAEARGRSLIEVLVGPLEQGVDPNLQRLEQQCRSQYRKLLCTELGFARRTCGLEGRKLLEVAKAARVRLDGAVKEFAAEHVAAPGRGAGRLSELRALVQLHLAEVLDELSPQQAKRYPAECEKHAAAVRRTVVLNLVARLDEQLVLTAEQREKLVRSLLSDYRPGWDQWLTLLAHNVRFVSAIPDGLVVPLLNDAQKRVWQQIPKQSYFIEGLDLSDAFPVPADDLEMQEVMRIVEEVENGK